MKEERWNIVLKPSRLDANDAAGRLRKAFDILIAAVFERLDVRERHRLDRLIGRSDQVDGWSALARTQPPRQDEM